MDKPADPATPFERSLPVVLRRPRARGHQALDHPSLPLQHRPVREVARRQRPPGDPGVAGADDPDRLPPVPRDIAAAAARLDPAAPRRADEPPYRPLLPAEHQVPGVVAEGRGPPRCQPVPRGQPLLQEEGRDAGPAGRRPDPEDRQAVRRRDPAAGCAGDGPEDLRDRALVWVLYSSGIRAADAVEADDPGDRLRDRGPVHRGRQGRQGPPGIHQRNGRRARPRVHRSRTDPAPGADAAAARPDPGRNASNLLGTESCSCRAGAGRARSGSHRRASCRS